MVKTAVYNTEGKKIGEASLPDAIFAVQPKHVLIHQALIAQQANARSPWAHTKTRGEVRGGGKKPWRQKGTGRARAGSIRSPIWVGGGVTFGPRAERSYTKKLNAKAKRKALFMVLTSKVLDKQLVIVDQLKLAAPKTAELARILVKLPVGDHSTLLAFGGVSEDKDVWRAGHNLPQLKMTRADSLNVGDLLTYEYLLLPKTALDLMQKTFRVKPVPEITSVKKKATPSPKSRAIKRQAEKGRKARK